MISGIFWRAGDGETVEKRGQTTFSDEVEAMIGRGAQ